MWLACLVLQTKFPICGRAAAQRDVVLDPSPSAGPPEGAVSEGDIP